MTNEKNPIVKLDLYDEYRLKKHYNQFPICRFSMMSPEEKTMWMIENAGKRVCKNYAVKQEETDITEEPALII